jgi:hypothetical protein
MKKGLSIFLSLLMLTAVMHLSVATHYCRGEKAGSRVSLTGKLADCGMEASENKFPLPGTSFTRHCCDDIVTFCGTDNNYTPSFSFIPESYQYNFQFLALTVGLSVNSKADLIPSFTNESAPGVLMSTNVDLSDICVFRI